MKKQNILAVVALSLFLVEMFSVVSFFRHNPVILVVMFGFLQSQMFQITHQMIHNTWFSSSLENKIVGSFFLLLIFNSWFYYKKEHMLHHRALKQEDDPGEERYASWGLSESRGAIWVLCVNPLRLVCRLWYAKEVFQLARIDPKKVGYPLLFFWVALFFFCYLTGFLDLLACWVVAFNTMYLILFYWSEVSDHYHVYGDQDTRNSASGFLFWFTRGSFFAFFDGFHAAHHKDASVPWYLLRSKYFAEKDEDTKTTSFFSLYKDIKKQE